MTERTDFATYVDARWPDLVGGLEDEGVPGDRARLAVAEALLAARRSWQRRVRDEQVDVTLWAEVRERAGLPARPGEPAPHAVRPRDPRDGPEEWLERAAEVRAARRRRGARRAVAGLAVVALLAAGWAWWAAQPEPPPCARRPTGSRSRGTPRASCTSRTWWSSSRRSRRSSPTRDGARGRRGRPAAVGRGGAGGRGGRGRAGRRRARRPRRGPRGAARPRPRRCTTCGWRACPWPAADGPTSSTPHAGPVQRTTLRQSETGRRAVVVCPTEWTCQAPVTVPAGGTVRLR